MLVSPFSSHMIFGFCIFYAGSIIVLYAQPRNYRNTTYRVVVFFITKSSNSFSLV